MTVLAQRSLAGGELAPSLHSRIDVAKFGSALARMRNWQVMRHGGARTRAGFYHLCAVKDHSRHTRVVPFIYGDLDVVSNFVIEFGHLYTRFIAAGYYPLLEDYLDVASISQASPGVWTVTGNTFANGDDVVLDGDFPDPDMAEEMDGSARRFKIRDKAGDTFTLEYTDGPLKGTKVSTAEWDLTSYSSAEVAVGRVLEVTTPYVEGDLFRLNFAQSGSTLTIVHPSYAPRDLTWDGSNWALGTITYAPGISAPTNPTFAGATNGQIVRGYKVTAIADETLEESLATAVVNSATTDKYLEWTAVSGAQEYNVYGYGPAGYGLMAIVEPNTSGSGGKVQWLIDSLINPDIAEKFPVARNPFGSANNYPSTVNYMQQRKAYGATLNDPEKVWLTKTGFFKNFTTRSPIQDDDAITFIMAGKSRNKVKHLLDLGRLVVLTESSEKKCEGGGDGVLTPFAIHPRSQTYYGAGDVTPVVIGEEALYVQARASRIRNIGFTSSSDSYSGRDLTVFSTHLFDDYTIIEMAFQQVPHSSLWVVRSDGVLLSLTYLPEHQIEGWSRHDTQGSFESVCTAPYFNDDVVYAVVKRTINGEEMRFIEAMDSALGFRQCGLDGCSGREATDLSFDVLTEITLTGGSDWDEEETLTATVETANTGGLFEERVALHRGLVIHHPVHGMVRLAIEGWTNEKVFTVRPDRVVPEAFRGVSTAVVEDTAVYPSTKRLEGLWHLEGEEVGIVAGERAFVKNSQTNALENVEKPQVVGNPFNPSLPVYTVENGQILLEEHLVFPRVGLPYLCDLETLNIDSVQKPLVDNLKKVDGVVLQVEKSRGLWAGGAPPSDDDTDATEGLDEAKEKDTEGYDEAINALTGELDIPIDSSWNSNGRVFIRQLDPLESTVTAIFPRISIAEGR